MKNWLPLLLSIIIVFLLLYKSCETTPSSNFNNNKDSLELVINNLKQKANSSDSIINFSQARFTLLQEEIDSLSKVKNKIKYLYINYNNSNLNDKDSLIKFYTLRYPISDTNKITLPKQTLVKVATDLIICDGIKQELIITDSLNSKLVKGIELKDSTINAYKTKDTVQQKIISTQDVKYKAIEKDNSKLRTYLSITSGWIIIITTLFALK